MQQLVLMPNRIRVTESYFYYSNMSGSYEAKRLSATGLIEVSVPYKRSKSSYNGWINRSGNPQSFNTLIHDLQTSTGGHLRVVDYGESNLNRQTGMNWDRNVLPIVPNLSEQEWLESGIQNLNSFELNMTHSYKPEPRRSIPILTKIQILDEEYIEKNRANKGDIDLIEELIKQASLKHSLSILFQVTVILPDYISEQYKRKPLLVSRMAFSWPIAMPKRLASIRIKNIIKRRIHYNPEEGSIEWYDIPLRRRNTEVTGINVFVSDLIRLEIREPVQLYQLSKLTGRIVVETEGLLSGLELYYVNLARETNTLTPEYRTILLNNFEVNLKEGFERKMYSPRHHLWFPGVVLDEMRVADVMMLLEDRGFEVEKPKPDFEQENDSNGASDNRKVVIEASRNEGARTLHLYILMCGTGAKTTRERKTFGETLYRTPLPTGITTIYIHAQFEGDNKRVVSEVNDIQRQLKERFRHVGVAE